MATMKEYARQPILERVERLGRTADELVTTIKDRDEATLARRPDARNFAAPSRREYWLPFVNSYRTLCLAPSSQARVVFDRLAALMRTR